MTEHYIEEHNKFYWYIDSQQGSNTHPVNGKYTTITDYTRTVLRYSPRVRIVKYDRYTQQYQESILGTACPSWSPAIDKWNVQKAKCLVKLHTAFDSVQLAKDLAEACTASCTFFSRVPQSIRYLKRGQFAKAYNALAGVSKARQSIPNTWLQYQWAVKPLIGELEELWEKLQPKDAPVFKISSAVGGKDSNTLVEPNSFGLYLTEPFNVIWARKANRSVKTVRYFRHDVLDSEGFHFNPLNAIWDGITWSFLVDWFVPASDVLRGLAYSVPGCVGGFNNYREEMTWNVEGIYPYQAEHPSGRLVYQADFPCKYYRDYTFKRVPDTSVTLSAADVNALLWSSPAGLTLKRTLNLFMIAWKAAS